MLRFSTNLSAEVLGLMASGERRALADSAAKMNTWARTRLGLANAMFADHSGLSDRTRVAPVSFARAMVNAEQAFPEFASLLKPIKSRQFNGNLDKTGRAQIAAKTGTLNFVSALGGFQMSAGRKIAFAIFVQDFNKRAKVDHATNDRPRGASDWAKRARRLHHGLLYRWAQIER
jgi:D-alanyl-D-alanine carboxypeptidase/D-alanyl-D-alanine-endopeptidase (penicillin-binding protein 4)